MGPILTQSQTVNDALTGTGTCASNTSRVPSGQQSRCGLGPRQPLLVISPWAKQNFVDNTLTDQSSVVRFIEDNFLGSQRIGQGSADANAGLLTNMFDFSESKGQASELLLDPSSGEANGSK